MIKSIKTAINTLTSQSNTQTVGKESTSLKIQVNKQTELIANTKNLLDQIKKEL